MRDLYQGILQIGVGLYHRGRGNRRGAISLTRRGIGRLRALAPGCQQVDVATLISESLVVLAELESLDPAAEPRAPAPVVRWRDQAPGTSSG